MVSIVISKEVVTTNKTRARSAVFQSSVTQMVISPTIRPLLKLEIYALEGPTQCLRQP